MAEDKLDKISKKLDGVADDVRTANFRIDKIESKFDLMGDKIDKLTDVIRDLSSNVKTMSGHMASALGKVMEHEERLDSVEVRVSVLRLEFSNGSSYTTLYR